MARKSKRTRALDRIPQEFHTAVITIAFDNGGETYGEEYETNLIVDIVDRLLGPIEEYGYRRWNEGQRELEEENNQ